VLRSIGKMLLPVMRCLLFTTLLSSYAVNGLSVPNPAGVPFAHREPARRLLAPAPQISSAQSAQQNATVIVVGAGVAGLGAAKRLSDQVIPPENQGWQCFEIPEGHHVT
jgi:hypothetical protein